MIASDISVREGVLAPEPSANRRSTDWSPRTWRSCATCCRDRSVANEEGVDHYLVAQDVDDDIIVAFHEPEKIFLTDAYNGLPRTAAHFNHVLLKALNRLWSDHD